jgi:hypothetical protein
MATTVMVDAVDGDIALSKGTGIVLGVQRGVAWAVTADHVVSRDGATSIRVAFDGVLSPVSVDVSTVCHIPEKDVALMRFSVPAGVTDRTPTISDKLEGDDLFGIGRSEENLWDRNTTAATRVSDTGSIITFSNADRIVPGYSGGGLFDDSWRLVGMIVLKSGESKKAIAISSVIADAQAACANLADFPPVQPSTALPAVQSTIANLASALSTRASAATPELAVTVEERVRAIFPAMPGWLLKSIRVHAGTWTTSVNIACGEYKRSGARTVVARNCDVIWIFKPLDGAAQSKPERRRNNTFTLDHGSTGWTVVSWNGPGIGGS